MFACSNNELVYHCFFCEAYNKTEHTTCLDNNWITLLSNMTNITESEIEQKLKRFMIALEGTKQELKNAS